jgi:glyoxylase-like metal-dependent hydrolase (beta-lactamase superfamily II)
MAIDMALHLFGNVSKAIDMCCQLKFINTPGHARHHVCIWDEKSRGIFSGDTLGVSYREFDTTQGVLIFPPTTPIQFDPDALK